MKSTRKPAEKEIERLTKWFGAFKRARVTRMTVLVATSKKPGVKNKSPGPWPSTKLNKKKSTTVGHPCKIMLVELKEEK